MTNSEQCTSPNGMGTIVNSKNFEVALQKRDGSCVALGPKKKLRFVLEEDFKALPAGVKFILG